MSQPAPSVEGAFRTLRTIHFALMASLFLYIWAGEKVLPHNQQTPDRLFATLTGLVAATMFVAAIVVRAKMVQPALELLQTEPDNKQSIGRWRSGSIISYVLAETVALFGFSLRSLGGTLAMSAPFYIAAILLMLFLRPRRP
jgi:hypothetical protein